jgi:hypothetical protein
VGRLTAFSSTMPKRRCLDAQKLQGNIQEELARVRERLHSDVAKLPAENTPQQLESARKVRTMLTHVFTAQLETLGQIAEDEKACEAAEKAEREWAGFPQPPPYSSLLAHDVRMISMRVLCRSGWTSGMTSC